MVRGARVRIHLFGMVSALAVAGMARAQEPPAVPPPPPEQGQPPAEPPPYRNPEPLPPPPLSANTTPTEQDAPQPTPPPTKPQSGANTFAGFVDFNVYPWLSTVPGDSVFSINTLLILPRGFSYFAFVNYNNSPNRKPFMDTDGYYTEHTLNYTFWDKLPIDALIQYNARSGPANDRFRVGFRLRVDAVPYLGDLLKKAYISYGVNFHFYQLDHQTDRYVWQIEQFGRMDFPYLDNRLYFAAFGDRTFNEGLQKLLGLRRKNPLVSEIQAGLRLYDQLYFIYEFRILEYRPSDVLNHAIGGQYVAKW